MKAFASFRSIVSVVLAAIIVLVPLSAVRAQDPVTGSIEGDVFDKAGKALAGVRVRFIDEESGAILAKLTNSSGHYSQGALPPGKYRIAYSKDGYVSFEKFFYNYATRSNTVLPAVNLAAETTAMATAQPSPGQPTTNPTPQTSPSPAPTGGSMALEEPDLAGELNRSDARRGGAYTDKQVPALPIGGSTLTRSFDELGLFVPGVAPPPPTQGDVAGPGVGSGVGSAGQFAVNGMRSRSNNFTVDGSDNNDEDIGVRRQGFFSLVPQPIESIKEFQITTLLAPAQYGRNFGGQVNAISKSGGKEFHGTVYGFFNSSQLNTRNPFDTDNGNTISPVRSSANQAVLDCGDYNTNGLQQLSNAQCIARNRALTTTNFSGGEDSSTLGQGGIVFGGPIKKDKAFFFLSYERQVLNASKEASFAVPTIDRRGIFNTGATGLFADCLTPLVAGFNITNCTPANASRFFGEFGFPTALAGDAVLSLMPLPNNPAGVYGANTFTEVLPASARGNVLSAKYDQKFNLWGKAQSFTTRYNFTQDWRDIPVTGEALFSSLRPRVRTQNFSTFLNSALSGSTINQLRLSYGRTRLVFDELRDPFLRASETPSNDSRFLLNATLFENDTINSQVGVPYTGPVLIRRAGTTECGLGCNNAGQFNGIGRVGQINIAGFSPIGVDVNNFPQSRVNNTYQLADTVTHQRGRHSITFGADVRRVELNSDLPRNSRTQLNFNGAPEFDNDPNSPNFFTGNFVPGIDFAAAGAPSGAFLSLATTDSKIGLRYYEYNFFGQDEWRIRPGLSINFGLRYEFNTPPHETGDKIEKTFSNPLLSNRNVSGLSSFIDGRTKIFDSDRNNFEPRVGIAWSPNLGSKHSTIVRAGFGVFHDQILGALVSQSRNVFPNFITVNTGGFGGLQGGQIGFFNPARGGICLTKIQGVCTNFQPLVQPQTRNALNPLLVQALVLDCFAGNATNTCSGSLTNSINITLPERNLHTPSAEHYSVMVDQEINRNLIFSLGYVGTRGHDLLRAGTPNLGANNLLLPTEVFAGVEGTSGRVPEFHAFVLPPFNSAIQDFGRPSGPGAGPVLIYNGGGRSRYDALQFQLRGRYHFIGSTQFQVNYTFSRGRDDASDVFDLGGSFALPQDSLTLAGEYYRSSFDAMHRVSYNYITDAPHFDNSTTQAIFGNIQIAGTGQFQTGLPFTINSIFDVNADGNLTDRLNSTKGLVSTGDRSRPYVLTVDPTTLLAAIGEDGKIRRNSFRATNLFVSNLAIIKTIPFSERYKLSLRTEIFNVLNRTNYGIPVRFLESPGFGRSTNTVTPARRIQFALKFSF